MYIKEEFVMKAIQINQYGHSDVLNIKKDIPKPTVTSGHILVEVYAAGVNPIDWKIREGHLQNMIKIQFPMTLGVDFAGVVAEVGEGVTDFKKGDQVFGMSSFARDGLGSFAEFVLVDARHIAHKPKKLNFVEAAALPLAGVSALQALVEIMKVSPGKKILIHGGSGGVGSVAIQLAKHFGCHVATTVRDKNKKFVKDLGADEVIDFEKQAFEDILHDFDAVLDTVGGDTYIKSFKVIKNGGIIVSLLEQPRKENSEKYASMLAHLRQETGESPKVTATFMLTGINKDRLTKLTELFNKGAFEVILDKSFSMGAAKEALDYQKDKHPHGKVVLEIKQDSGISKIKKKTANMVKERGS